MKILLIVCTLLTLAACTSEAQESPSVLEQALQQKYPNAKKVDWRKDDQGNQEAHFELDGEKYRADFTENGEWIETERSLDYKDLPEPVQDAIKEQYDKDDIEEIELVESATKGTFYDIEFKDKGKRFDVEYSAEGQVVGGEN